MTLKELFNAIANAIRGKKGSTAKIKASNFPQEIETIITKGEPYVFATEAQMDTFLGSTKAKDGDIVLYTGTTGTKYVNSKYYQIVKPVGEDGEYSIISTYLQEKTITPTKSNQIVEASGGYNGLSKVNVNAIPSDYIIPSGDITIEENGTKDVTQFKNAVVNVKGEIYMFNSTGALSTYLSNKAKTDDIFQWKGQNLTDPHLISDGYYKVNADKTYTLVDNSRGDITINQNGTYPVNYKANAIVNVQPSLQEKTVTPTKSTQNVTPDSNYDGLSKVTVNPIPSNYIIPDGLKSINSNGLFDVAAYSSAEVDVRGTPYTFSSTSSLSTYLSNEAKNGDVFQWKGQNNTSAGLEADTYYVVSKPSGGTATFSKINNDSAPSTITFYIDDSQFTTIKGYNWGGWVYSSNNTEGFAVGTNNIIYHPDASVYIQYNGANIKASDIIVSERHYNSGI